MLNLKLNSLSSHGLRHKLKIASCLMSILPLLVLVYFSSHYIMPAVINFKFYIGVAIVISVFIALIGFLLLKGVFDSVVCISAEAKMIASGEIERKVDVSAGDEVGDLGEALNHLTQRIRRNMEELKNYSEKTTEINIEIQKRVLVLSSLLQISSLISQGAKRDDILTVVTEKSRLLANSDVAYLAFREESEETFHIKAADGMNAQTLLGLQVGPAEPLFAIITKATKPMIIDQHHSLVAAQKLAFYNRLNLRNSLAMPIYLRGRVIGLLGIGNTTADFSYKKDDLELLDIFAKQVAIACENDVLTHRLDKLEIKDALTGLYNGGFIHNRLQEEIKRAILYRRPCAFIMFDIDNFQGFRQAFGALGAEATLKKIAILIRDSIGEIDRAGRTGDDEFSVVIPEKNKRQAQEIAEEIRRKVEATFAQEAEPSRRMTVSAGVSENPIDGVDADSLIAKAKDLCALAKSRGKNCVVGIERVTST